MTVIITKVQEWRSFSEERHFWYVYDILRNKFLEKYKKVRSAGLTFL